MEITGIIRPYQGSFIVLLYQGFALAFGGTFGEALHPWLISERPSGTPNYAVNKSQIIQSSIAGSRAHLGLCSIVTSGLKLELSRTMPISEVRIV
jgi:hypothetical protein